MKHHKHWSLTTKYAVTIGVLLLAANLLLGLLLLNHSKKDLHELLHRDMLNISNTAAALLDGDALGAMTADDVGGEAFMEVYNTLTDFQNNVDIEFIYAVRQVGEDTFVFTVDPDPEDPGQFGEEIVVTDAVRSAGKGVAAVDTAPAADRWGNFYSSYSPVFDSQGNVAGIVGVDFSAEWYDNHIRHHAVSTGIVSLLTAVVGVGAVVLLTSRTNKRFHELNQELSVLMSDVDELTEEITSTPGYQEFLRPEEREDTPKPDRPPAEDAGESDDEIGALGAKISVMQTAMRRYQEYAHAKAFTDGLTGVGNTSAYMAQVSELEESLAAGKARFDLVLFDIDHLKLINDRYGHGCGDRIIKGAAAVVAKVAGPGNTFRIGGDEFIAILEDVPEERLPGYLADIEREIGVFNAANEALDTALSLSMGAAACQDGDTAFRDVFNRADAAMYRQKDSHHRQDAAMA